VQVVDSWTGRHASALRRALRLTNEGLAEQLGTAVRTVAKWNADPELVPTPELQRALDTMLSQAPEDDRTRFALLLAADLPPAPAPAADAAAAELVRDGSDAAQALAWVDQAAGWDPGTAAALLPSRAARTDRKHAHELAAARARVGRHQVADALAGYYGTHDGHAPYVGRCAGQRLTTSVLTRPDWLDLRLPLGAGQEHLRYAGQPAKPVRVDRAGAGAAVDRIAAGLQADLRMVNAPIYRLIDVTVSAEGIAGSVGLAGFFDYALTLDLLEAELGDALTAGLPAEPGQLPLRDRYLPDLAAVLDVGARMCAGGPPALTAIARPTGRGRSRPDFLLLVQERSGRVLNAARRLAVIPKSFHGPLVDYAEDAQPYRSVEREMEEELFGREDVDSVFGDSRQADPMHRSRLSAPMGWLADHLDDDSWRMECTGFGFNLLTGNYEFASLIVVHDDRWWTAYGGHIEANWESTGLRRYSTLDRDALTALVLDPAWSNEGLFALLQGLRRLAEIGGDRTDLPDLDWET
jgi:hypothetical protein